MVLFYLPQNISSEKKKLKTLLGAKLSTRIAIVLDSYVKDSKMRWKEENAEHLQWF